MLGRIGDRKERLQTDDMNRHAFHVFLCPFFSQSLQMTANESIQWFVSVTNVPFNHPLPTHTHTQIQIINKCFAKGNHFKVFTCLHLCI